MLARLPSDARLDALIRDETDAERKLADQLVVDLARVGGDRTTRLGDKYGPAARWLERLERLYLAPPIVRPAADALGALQWRYGDLGDAALALARYGSERLATLVKAMSGSIDGEPARIASLIPLLLKHGRWPGEWLARAEALVHVLPSCTAEQITEIGEFVTAVREALGVSPGSVVRGASAEHPLSARAKIEELESSRWGLLSSRDAIDAIDVWVENVGAMPTRVLTFSHALQELERLPWRSWIESGAVDGGRVNEIALRLVDARLSLKRAENDTDDIEQLLDVLITLLRAKAVVATPQSALRERIDQLLALLATPRRSVFAVTLASVAGDSAKVAELVKAAFDTLDLTKRETIRPALDTVAAAGRCFDNNLTKVISALKDITERAANELAHEDPLRGRWAPSERAQLVGFVVSRLLASSQNAEENRLLIERASAAMAVLPVAAEYLTTFGANVLAATKTQVDDAVLDLLRAAGPIDRLSRRDQHYAGLRGVARALVQVGTGAINEEWLVNVAALARGGDVDLARYAAWILGEWAARVLAGQADELVRTLVAPTLRAIAFDNRVVVRANGIRGLVALERTIPSAESRDALAPQAADKRIAIQRALTGTGSL